MKKKNNKYALISGGVFGAIAALQATRAALKVPAQIGTHAVPVWISWIGGAAAGSLCAWAFRTARPE